MAGKIKLLVVDDEDSLRTLMRNELEESGFEVGEADNGFGGTQRLSRLVGKGVAKEMVLTGRMLDAAEAKSLGLVTRVFPADTFMEECLKVARSLAAKGRVSLSAAKRAIDRGFDLDLKNACLLEVDSF